MRVSQKMALSGAAEWGTHGTQVPEAGEWEGRDIQQVWGPGEWGGQKTEVCGTATTPSKSSAGVPGNHDTQEVCRVAATLSRCAGWP